MTWVQPFDILLKYKEMAGEVEVQKEKGLAMNYITNPVLSGGRDLNSRPLAPQASALPGCATTRKNYC